MRYREREKDEVYSRERRDRDKMKDEKVGEREEGILRGMRRRGKTKEKEKERGGKRKEKKKMKGEEGEGKGC